jgi:hypothetical protein
MRKSPSESARSVSWMATVCSPAVALVLGLFLGLATPPAICAGGGDEEKKPPQDSRKKDEKKEPGKKDAGDAPLSFTNEDLSRFHRRPADDPPPSDPAEGGQETPGASTPSESPAERGGKPAADTGSEDPLKAFHERKVREEQRAAAVQAIRERIRTLESRMQYLADKRQAILDPYRIMPESQTTEDRQKDGSLGVRDLLAAVEEEIKTTGTQLRAAREELIGVQTQFDAVSQGGK